MTGIVREPCTQCGEPASLDARICPHCKSGLLVGVAVDQSTPDGRERYRIAREIIALGLPGLSLGSVQAGLSSPGTPLAKSLTRAAARLLSETLQEQGLSASLQYAAPAQAKGGGGSGTVGKLLLVAALLAAIALGAHQAWQRFRPAAAASATQAEPASQDPLSTRDIAQLAGPSAVSVSCRDSMGAGFFVAPNLILTNEHVTCGDEALLTVTCADGLELAGQVRSADPWLDLALVEVLGEGKVPLELGDATRLVQGDEVVLIGSPRGLEFSLAEGVISSADRHHYGVGYLQVDANVNPGNSGGPLLDKRGRVIGIVSMMVGEASGLGLALPVNYAYVGEEALLADWPPAYDSAAWESRLTRSAEADEEEVERVREAFGQQPGGLVGLSRQSSGIYVATIALRVGDYPGNWRADLSVWQNDERQCGRSYQVEQPRSFEDYARGGDRRFLEWMKTRGLTEGLFVGHVRMGLRRECPLVDWSMPSELRVGVDRITIPAGG